MLLRRAGAADEEIQPESPRLFRTKWLKAGRYQLVAIAAGDPRKEIITDIVVLDNSRCVPTGGMRASQVYRLPSH
jgi:hypothetical protein